MINFDKENSKATTQLKKLLKGIQGVRFTNEKPDGFYFKTDRGEFWFQCETSELEEDK